MAEPRTMSDAELVRHAHELIRSVANAEAFFHTDTAEYLTKKARRDEAEAELLRRLAAARPAGAEPITDDAGVVWYPLHPREAKWLLDWIGPLVDSEWKEGLVNSLRRQMGRPTIAGTFSPRVPPAARPARDQTVTISLDTANWASVAFAHAPWSDDPEVREHVRRASQELGAAIDVALEALAAAEGGPEEADHA